MTSASRRWKPVPDAVPKSVRELKLDPKNPRLASEHLTIEDQDEITRLLWTERAVNELVDSIAASGYWPHEELFAAHESGHLVVIEGNRRLAAVKLLTDDALCQRLKIGTIPKLSAADRKKLENLPVVVCKRSDVWEYIGFKHVNGPQDWDSIAKAEYIARVHNDYKIELSEIAKTIGDRHDTVRRLYRGLMVLRQAEQSGQFDVEDRYNTRFAYSHLWTGLGYENIQTFLGITPDKSFAPNPVPKPNLNKLGELCLWLYGSKKDSREPVVRSQNPDLLRLNEALGEKNGVAALRGGLPLATALKASRGDPRLLREALVLAEQHLKEARGYVPLGFTGNDSELLSKAKGIAIIAQTIADEMEEIATKSDGRRTTQPRRKRGGE